MALKNLLGNIDFAVVLYDSVRKTRPRTRYNLEQLNAALPAAVEQVRPFAKQAQAEKKLLLFATLHYWIEQAAMIGLTLRGLGHKVTMAYLPYGDLSKEINRFDLRRQDLYTQRVLAPLEGLVSTASLLDVKPASVLPGNLVDEIALVSTYDTQYTLQIEEVDENSDLYRLRYNRNDYIARAALAYIQAEKPDVVLIPNGTITELGAVYRVARKLGVRTVTYEFNDQREQVWIAQDEQVMRQRTDDLWAARGGHKLTDDQRSLVEDLESARRGAKAFGKSERKWQDVKTVGGEQLRKDLGLDERTVVLLATNVLGDSLTLGRKTFAKSMAAWIAETVRFLASKPEVQLVMRVHPGERLTHGRSMIDVVNEALPSIPEHIHIIGPMEKVNTYDLMEVASLGLVYTTTTGMEMTMRGIPVIVCGETHYRKRGFTLDPQDWGEYYAMLDAAIKNPKRLSQAQIEIAWEYAYRFFFEYPQPFPWRLMHFWKDVDVWPLGRVLSEEGQAEYKQTFEYLAGKPIKW
ncbi:MAG: hypothetical protein QGD96_05530 [Anaerolineae bacterium]|nr:hypothetical protein [Anaerolineae bacterium]